MQAYARNAAARVALYASTTTQHSSRNNARGSGAAATSATSRAATAAAAAAAAAAASMFSSSVFADTALASSSGAASGTPAGDWNPFMSDMRQLPSQQSASNDQKSEASSSAAINSDVARARALRALALAANRSDALSAESNAETVAALVESLFECTKLPREHSLPLCVNLLRALADIASAEGGKSIPLLLDHSAPSAIVTALRVFPVAKVPADGWLSWAARSFGFLTDEEGENKKEDVSEKENDHALAPAAGLSTIGSMSLRSAAMLEASDTDLSAGVAYHALRALSCMAREPSSHKSLLQAGVLEAAISPLHGIRSSHVRDSDYQRAESLRSAVLIIAALSKNASKEVTSLRGHDILLSLAASSLDTVAQTYAAAGLRNLARHRPENTELEISSHRELIWAGFAQSVKDAMSATRNPTAQKFGLLAFADVFNTAHPKQDVVRYRLAPAYTSLAPLINSPNKDVANAARRVVETIFGAPEVTETSVEPIKKKKDSQIPKAFSDSFVASLPQFIVGPVARGDVTAMRALASLCGHAALAPALFQAHVAESLRDTISRARGPLLEVAHMALARLCAHPDASKRLAEANVIDAALARPPGNEATLAKLVANVSREEGLRTQVARASASRLAAIAHSRSQVAKAHAVRAVYNLTLSGVPRLIVAQQPGVIGALVRAAREGAEEGCENDMRTWAVGAIGSIGGAIEYAPKILEAGGLEVLLSTVKNCSGQAKIHAARALASLSASPDVHTALVSTGVAKWMVETVKSGDLSETGVFALVGLCNLMNTPGAHKEFVSKSGVVGRLNVLANAGMGPAEVVHVARQALTNLKGDNPSWVPLSYGSSKPEPA